MRLPSLTDAYGLYYNKDLLAKAGITSPPKTMTELMDDAKKLTVRNPDGSIKVAGFVPLNEWEELGPSDLGGDGGRSVRLQRRSAALHRSRLDVALEWQKQLIDWYGYDNIEKFFATYTNAEFNANNAFQTGKVAMTFDGEWRTAFIARATPSSTTTPRRSRSPTTIPTCTARAASAARWSASPRAPPIPTRRGSS